MWQDTKGRIPNPFNKRLYYYAYVLYHNRILIDGSHPTYQAAERFGWEHYRDFGEPKVWESKSSQKQIAADEIRHDMAEHFNNLLPTINRRMFAMPKHAPDRDDNNYEYDDGGDY